MPEAISRSARARHLGGSLMLAAILIILDQVSKAVFVQMLNYGERLNILPVFDFTLLYNTGAAFSFLADGAGGQRWFFSAIALIAAIVIVRLLYTHTGNTLFCAALSCILGGALGNAIDRLAHGHVVDFLLFYWKGWYFPAFNIADIAITCGAGLLIFDEIQQARRRKAR